MVTTRPFQGLDESPILSWDIEPSKEELYNLVWSMATKEVAKKYGVTDKAIEKWCYKLNIKKPPRGYWQKKKFNKI